MRFPAHPGRDEIVDCSRCRRPIVSNANRKLAEDGLIDELALGSVPS